MLAPWECLEAVSKALVPGGILCCYVATTTQLARTVESIREIGRFNEPPPGRSMVRNWHVEGLAVRPDHRMIGHTGFLLTARRLADGVEPPAAPPPPRQGRLRRGLRRPATPTAAPAADGGPVAAYQRATRRACEFPTARGNSRRGTVRVDAHDS